MKEVYRTNNPVDLSYAQSLLSDEGIEAFVLDSGMSSLYGGGLPFIQQRIMVADEDAHLAMSVLKDLPRDSQ